MGKITTINRSSPDLRSDHRPRMSPHPIVIHERLGAWSRQLRPRLAGDAIAWSESRSASDLVRALAGSVAAIVVVDLGDAPARRLDDLALARRSARDGLILALDPRGRPDVSPIARELGGDPGPFRHDNPARGGRGDRPLAALGPGSRPGRWLVGLAQPARAPGIWPEPHIVLRSNPPNLRTSRPKDHARCSARRLPA